MNDLQELVCGEKIRCYEPAQSSGKVGLKQNWEKFLTELTEPEFAKCAREIRAVIEFYVRMLFSCLVDADFSGYRTIQA